MKIVALDSPRPQNNPPTGFHPSPPLLHFTINHLITLQALPQGPWTTLFPHDSTDPSPITTTNNNANNNTPSLGCDSSTCTYCQGLAARRQLVAPGYGVCWLRRKRSENELAGILTAQPTTNTNTTNTTAPVPDVDVSQRHQHSTSMWDHALMEPHEAAIAINARLLGGTQATPTPPTSAPWTWNPDVYLRRPDPIPSTLVELARFTSPSTPSLPNSSGSGSSGGGGGTNHDIVCGMEWEEHGWLLATAGVSKQVRVYSLASFLQHQGQQQQGQGDMPTYHNNTKRKSKKTDGYGHPIKVHRLPSKLSSLAWNPYQEGSVTVGDYDGVVTQIDLECGHVVAEQDEHRGRRVWSVSHSHCRPHLAASGSEDGSAAVWGGQGLRHIIARVCPSGSSGNSTGGGAAVTGVCLSPFTDTALAVACADSRAYLYDLRKLHTPVAVFEGHSRPVSYVKFLDASTLVTAAVDSTLATWDLLATSTSTSTSTYNTPTRVFRGHTNGKNFVGLAVRPEDRLVACGSETKEQGCGPGGNPTSTSSSSSSSSSVYAYSMAWECPLTSYEFGTDSVFCSAVAWQPSQGSRSGIGPVLAAATSDGQVSVLGLAMAGEEEEDEEEEEDSPMVE